ncbi:MAG TPA: hypothetical protein VG929_02275 [Actinomycetota bacterium]|nr:hypothetical protein [Actinomycetota bacterium]
MRMRSLFLALSLSLVATGAGVAQAAEDPVGAAPARSCAKPTRIHAFHVETKWSRKIYRRSEKAVVVVTVTRPAHEDPAGNGIVVPAPVSIPQEGVTVSTTIQPKKFLFPPLYGSGLTDENGKVRFAIPLKRLRPETVDASTMATLMTNEGGCPDIEEWGWRYDRPAFTVTD